MVHKDNTIIIGLIILFLITLGAVCALNEEIDSLNKTIDYILAVNELQQAEINNLMQYQSMQDERIEQVEHDIVILDMRLDLHRQQLHDDAELFTDLLGEVEHLEEHMRNLPDNVLGVTVNEQDIRDISALVYLEAGSQSYYCQKAIASVIFNRMIRYNMTAHQTIYEPGVFSPASRVSNTRPNASCIMAVREVLESGTVLPSNVVAFRNGHYHSFGRHYCNIDGVYFTAI